MSDEHISMIDDCEARESRLTDWERDFLESIREQIEDGRVLTEKQSAKLDAIWERVTAHG